MDVRDRHRERWEIGRLDREKGGDCEDWMNFERPTDGCGGWW